MVDEAVDHGGGDDVVGEGFAPAAEGQVAGDDDGALFVAGRDELEEQVGCVGVEGQVADLVDDDQAVPLDLLEFGVELPCLMGGLESADSGAGGVEQDAVAVLRGLDPQADREVGLADAGRPEQDHVLSLRHVGARGEVG